MYPRNAASPERIAIGPVVQISDGAVQTSGVSISVLPQGGASGAGGGTTSYENGVVCYVPTQAETNYTSFIVTAYKTGCIPAGITVMTTASATPGYAGVDWSKVTNASSTVNLSATTVKTLTDAPSDSSGVTTLLSRLTSGRATNLDNLDAAITTRSTYAGADTAGTTTLLSRLSATRAGYLDNLSGGAVALASGVSISAGGIASTAFAAGAITASAFASGAIDAAALDSTAANEIRDAVWAKTFSELTGDPGATPTAADAMMLQHMALRNKRETDSSGGTDKLYNSAGTVILTASVSDSGTVFTKAKYA